MDEEIKMKKEFVMRGKTEKGLTEVLNFSGYKPGYAYRLTEFELFQSNIASGVEAQLCAIISAGKTALDPQSPDFNLAECIGTAIYENDAADHNQIAAFSVINDTFLITQNLLLTVFNTESHAINWQCRFESVKMSGPEEAATNYKQYLISDGS